MRLGTNVSKELLLRLVINLKSFSSHKHVDFFSQAQPSSEPMLYLEYDDDHQGNLPAVEGSHLGSSAPQLPPSGTFLRLTFDIMAGQCFASLPAN